MILVTGSEGLIGSALVRALELSGQPFKGIDIKRPTIAQSCIQGSILDADIMRELIRQSSGIVHLAAVSRVIHGQQNPDLCRKLNVDATETILTHIRESGHRPWILYGSSREVYGNPVFFPVTEDHPVSPINIYGETKAQAEALIKGHGELGFPACIIRFSNVFGDPVFDHLDRVVPAFAQKAAYGGVIRVDGSYNSFDFTFLRDVIHGLLCLIERIQQSTSYLSPIQFVSGIETTLGSLAELALDSAHGKVLVREAPSRDYDVSRFYGSYERAKSVLSWEPKVDLKAGFRELVAAYIDVQAGGGNNVI